MQSQNVLKLKKPRGQNDEQAPGMSNHQWPTKSSEFLSAITHDE